MKIRLFNKIRSNEGLSLIEVLIVMALSGLTLVALLNLATRNLLIEQINQYQDTASFIGYSQIEDFDYIKTSVDTSSCLANLPVGTYLVCGQYTPPGLTPVPQCVSQQPSGGTQAWNIYSVPSGTTAYMSLIPSGGYDCTSPYTKPPVYKVNLQVTNAGSGFLTMTSNVSFNAFDGNIYPLSYSTQYYY